MLQNIEQRGELGELRIENDTDIESYNSLELPLNSTGGVLYRWLRINFSELSGMEVRDILFPAEADARQREEEYYHLSSHRAKPLESWIANADEVQVDLLNKRDIHMALNVLGQLEPERLEAIHARFGQVVMARVMTQKASPQEL